MPRGTPAIADSPLFKLPLELRFDIYELVLIRNSTYFQSQELAVLEMLIGYCQSATYLHASLS